MSLTTLLLGRRLANREAEGRKIGPFEGVPAMGLDGLGSASYGLEAMLTMLAVVGTAGLAAVQPISRSGRTNWGRVLAMFARRTHSPGTCCVQSGPGSAA